MLQRLKADPKRVLMTLDAVGGVWRYAMDLAQGLKAHEVHFLFLGMGPEPSPAQKAEAEALGELAWLEGPLDWTTEDEAALDALPRAIEALAPNVDLIHLNAPTQAAGFRTAKPVLVVSHSCVVTWFAAVRGAPCPPGWSWQLSRNKAGLSTADTVVAPSRSHARALEDCYGPLPALSVVYNASAAPHDRSATKQEIVFAAGRWWDEGKNAALLDAMAPTVDWPVQLAGALRSPSGQSVELWHAETLGPLSAEDVRRHLSQAAIVVSPSLYEPFGLVPLEAAGAGAALVLADIPTYRELWDGCALFADPRDPAGFAAAVNRLIAEPGLRAELGRRAQGRAADFTLAAQAEAMWGLYCALVHDHAH